MTNKTQTEKNLRVLHKNKDEKGVILTYVIMDLNRSELKDFKEAEFNTRKELNDYLKQHPLK